MELHNIHERDKRKYVLKIEGEKLIKAYYSGTLHVIWQIRNIVGGFHKMHFDLIVGVIRPNL